MVEKVVKVTKTEFELESGKVFPIVPPLQYETTPEEFQEHYERACAIIKSIQDAGSDDQHIT